VSPLIDFLSGFKLILRKFSIVVLAKFELSEKSMKNSIPFSYLENYLFVACKNKADLAFLSHLKKFDRILHVNVLK